MYKQVIIARKDLNMSPGKLAVQVAHGSMAFLTTAIRRNSKACTVYDYDESYLRNDYWFESWIGEELFEQWINGKYTKCILQAKNKDNLLKAKIMAEELGMTEKDCLEYCYSSGIHWHEEGIDLYSILDRVSCWCCQNKNLKELKNMYLYLPKYWESLKGLQSRIDSPMKGDGKSVFQLEERFKKEIESEIK